MLFFDRFKQTAIKQKPEKHILELDLGMGHGEVLIYRFESWENGLKCTVENSEGISERRFEEDLPIKFSHLAYLQHSQDWLSSFPADLPNRIISFQYNYTGQLYPVLLLLAGSSRNLELFIDLPVLFWAAFVTARKADMDQQQITELLSRPRTELLKFCGLPNNKATLNLLRKLRFERMNDLLWKQFHQFSLLAMEHKELNHVRVITEGALQFVSRYPELTKAGFLPASDETTKWDDILEATAEIYRMSELLGDPVDQLRIKRAKDYLALNRYHDALSEKILENSFTDEVQNFPAPLLPGNESIEPILDSYELALEGKSMNHCVYSYSQDILDGLCSVYRVTAPERATLKLIVGEDGLPGIKELKLRSNKPAAKTTYQLVNNWIKSHLLNGGARHG